jgi:hypothetical protein
MLKRSPVRRSKRKPTTNLSSQLIVPLTTLAPEPLELERPIPIVIRPVDDGYVATFFDANINMSGDTEQEAFENVKLLLIDIYEELDAGAKALGPELERQLAVLRTYIRRKEPHGQGHQAARGSHRQEAASCPA